MIIAIDGPAGAGKSTIATAVARTLGFQLIDTGAMFRTVAVKAEELGIDLEDGSQVAKLASELEFSFELEEAGNVVFCNGERMGDTIRTPDASRHASIVSAHPQVRQVLLNLQRAAGKRAPSVIEGRDIGTVVFPDAEVKIFLTANPNVRAQRRVEQLRFAGEDSEFEEVLDEIVKRDERDTTRQVAPLVKADDAIEVDSSTQSVEEIVARVVAQIKSP